MNTQLTLGSLFDGIGGFPLAGIYAGMKPVWASEIEPFPIRVTSIRFPEMKHLGDIHDMNGGEIEPVDVITFGSPCTDLSVAGKRSGLGGKQSSLFFEAVRVITEMREKTNGTKPRWVVWENVPGALSSAGGDDFRAVLESLAQIKDREAVIPLPDKGKWLSAGEIMGSDYSVAWRILDAAKGWGVAQRRRRIFAVVDLDGQRAGQVLFESEGVSGYTPPRGEAREGTAESTADGAGEGRRIRCLNPWDTNSQRVYAASGVYPTIPANECGGQNRQAVCHAIDRDISQAPLALKIRSGCDGGGKGALIQRDLSATLGCNNDQTLFVPKAYGISSDQSNAMLSENPHSGIYEADTSRTLDVNGGNPCCNQGGIAVVQPIAFAQNERDEVRDLHDVAGALSANPGMKQQTFVAAFMGGQGSEAGGLGYQEEMSPTLKSAPSGGNTVPDVVYAIQGNMIGRKDENGPQGAGINKEVCFSLNTVDRPAVAAPSYCMAVGNNEHVAEEASPTLTVRDYKDPPMVGKRATLASGKPQTGTLTANGMAHAAFLGNQEALSGDYFVLEPSYSLDRAAINQGPNALFGISIEEERTQTLVAQGPNAVAKPNAEAGYLVRRLTPGECCRLQGYPDGWCENLGSDEPTADEIRRWIRVHEAWYRAQGKKTKSPTEARIIKWLKDPRSDGAEYKAYGNSVCVNCVLMVMQGIVWAENTNLY